MRTYVIILVILLSFSLNTYAQSSDKKLTRKEKKELKEKQRKKDAEEMAQLIASKKFVFQADQIVDRQGKSYSVSSSINFIGIDSNIAVFQLGSTMLIGINGIGGITIQGEITSFKITRNEKNSYHYLVIKIAANSGFYEIQMDISPSGIASAKVTTSGYERIIYKGVIVDLDNTTIFQGITY